MSNPCTRFEREGLPTLLRGQQLDEHFQTCADCSAQRSLYARLEEDLATFGADDRPPTNYQAKIWARISQNRTIARPWYRRWWWLALPAPVLALIALLLPWQRDPDHQDRPGVRYTIARQAGARAVRTMTAAPGSELLIHATKGGARVAELRVYRGNDELVLHCVDEPPCERHDNELSARMELPGRGDYHVLLLTSSRPVPAPVPALATDIAAAERAGAVVRRDELLLVR
jgi:hypothetical protein